MHTCIIWYLASRAYPYRFCKLASRVRIAVYYFASSVQIRIRANFCTGLLGTPPKPRNHTSCELRVFTLRIYSEKQNYHIISSVLFDILPILVLQYLSVFPEEDNSCLLIPCQLEQHPGGHISVRAHQHLFMFCSNCPCADLLHFTRDAVVVCDLCGKR